MSAPSSKELAKLLVMLEAAEEELSPGLNIALKRLARLNDEAKAAALANPDPQVRNENPIGTKIVLAMIKGRDNDV